MIRWALYLPIMLVFGMISKALAPILPAFREDRHGPIDNNHGTAIEPRLPKWLAWFDTDDNSLYGDHGWKTKHTKDHTSYWGMVGWLLRNGGHGFNYKVIGCRAKPMPERKSGEYFWKRDDGYWLYRRFFKLTETRFVEVFLGWNLYGTVESRNKYVFQIRIKTEI